MATHIHYSLKSIIIVVLFVASQQCMIFFNTNMCACHKSHHDKLFFKVGTVKNILQFR